MSTWTLWQWSVKADDWEFVTEAPEDRRRKVLSTAKRRAPQGVRFKWTTGYKPKRFRQRMRRSGDNTAEQSIYICPYGCGKRSKYPLRGHAVECSMNPAVKYGGARRKK